MVFHVINRRVGRMKLFGKDADYEAFEGIIEEVLDVLPMRICCYCLMPNHWHLLLWPADDGDLAAFMQRLTTKHVRRWQLHRGKVGWGHVYQSRYKSFPIETDDYFYQVARYVERNALRAGLVQRAEAWRWSSLWRWTSGSIQQRRMLSRWPVSRPRDWVAHVNEPQTELELEAIRRSVSRSQPYGGGDWVKRTARKLGLESTLRPPHRPRKEQ